MYSESVACESVDKSSQKGYSVTSADFTETMAKTNREDARCSSFAMHAPRRFATTLQLQMRRWHPGCRLAAENREKSSRQVGNGEVLRVFSVE
jgi:hypothetical protein